MGHFSVENGPWSHPSYNTAFVMTKFHVFSSFFPGQNRFFPGYIYWEEKFAWHRYSLATLWAPNTIFPLDTVYCMAQSSAL